MLLILNTEKKVSLISVVPETQSTWSSEENLQPEASVFVLADVVLQVGLRQQGAPGNLLRQTHKQAACEEAHTHELCK